MTGVEPESVQFVRAAATGQDELLSPEERSVLDAINQKVAGAESLGRIMDFLFDSTQDVFPCDRIGLSFLEEDGQRVVAHWSRALYEPLLLDKGYAQDLRGSSLETVLKSGDVRIIRDLEHYLSEHPGSASTKLLVREGVRSSMTCPLIVEGRPVGFLFRSSRTRNAYSPHQVRLHLAVAERLSQAVEKAYRIEQLEAANRSYFEILGFVSHELRSPLASMVMDIEMLLGGYLGALQDTQRQKLERMTKKADYLLGLINEYLDLARIESEQFEANIEKDVDFVEAVVTSSVDIVQSLMEEKRVQFVREVPEKGLRVDCDPSLLRIVLVNLLGNAVKYGEPSGGEIRLRVERPEGALRVSVWNRGPGFPPEQRSRLFRKFSRLQTPELLKRKGTGVGLYTTWRIVQVHGGRTWAKSEPGKWAEFVFEIPQPLPDPGQAARRARAS